MNIALTLKDITPKNINEKISKAVRQLSRQLGVEVSVEGRKHKQEHKGEPFLYRSHEELVYKWYNFFSTAINETYKMVIKHFGLPEIRVLSKADVLTHEGKIVYNPETGKPINKNDWNDFVKVLDKFLNRKLSGADKIVLDSKALGRILGRMVKYNKLSEVKDTLLQDIKYHNKTFDWISDSVKNMRNIMGEELSRSEQARIQVLQQSAAQKITKVSDSLKNDIKQILIDGIKARKSKSQLSQDLFDRMTGHNRDFQKIADTETQNSLNNAYLLDEVSGAEEGEKIYFKRVEIIDGNTCPFCKKMHGKIVLWSDHPLPDDKINDPIADIAIWDGKDWDGKKDFIANGVFHPYCRGMWMRYDKTVDALIAHTQNQTELYNRAVDQARAEFQGKGINKPHDKTPGFTNRIDEIYNEIGGIDNTLETKKSLTYSGHKLQDKYKFAGFEISIENKKDSTRSGKDKDGHEWHCKMYFDYGYIRGTEGVDGDHVDVYIGDNEQSASVYIVHQNDPVTGKYDEDKVMLGFNSLHDAKKAYLKQYDRPGFLGKVDVMPIEEFRNKVLSKNYHGKVIKSFSDRVKEIMEG